MSNIVTSAAYIRAMRNAYATDESDMFDLLTALAAEKEVMERWEPVALGDAPPSSLPNWNECALRVANSSFIEKRVADGGYGADPDTKLATELHRFIYEYDDADPYRSAWFRHRLERLVQSLTSAPQPAAPSDAGFQVSINGGQWKGPEGAGLNGNSVTLTVEAPQPFNWSENYQTIEAETFELVGQLVACHEEDSCPAVAWGRDWLKRVKPAPLTDSFVQQVPDKCDRIVWRNQYMHLDSLAASQPSVRGPLSDDDIESEFFNVTALRFLADHGNFHAGVRFAERMHGITGTQGGGNG